MNKHCFGFLSECANCKTPVSELYAETLDRALNGFGLCEVCKNKAEKQETELQKLSTVVVDPVIEVTDNESGMDRDNKRTKRDRQDN